MSLLLLIFSAPSAQAENLGLAEFISQVKAKNLAFQSSSLAQVAATTRAREGELLLAPTLFSTDQLAVDESRKTNPAMQGTKTQFNSYSLGVSQQTRYGLSGRLYYQLNYTALSGTNPTFVPEPSFHEGKPVVELTYSLWRNGFGSEIRSQLEAQEAASLAAADLQAFQARSVLIQAETAYWRLAIQREALGVQKENLERAQKIVNWNSRRVNLGLADASDLLQAQAVQRLRETELQATQDEVRAASQAFNLARGAEGAVVNETLDRFETILKALPESPKKLRLREDVEAARKQEQAAEAGSRTAAEKTMPTLELFAQAALNGRDPAFGTAVSESFKTDHPAGSVGVRFSMPLDFGLTSDLRGAYRQEAESANLRYQRKLQESESEWRDLSERLAEARKRLQLTQELETIQRSKFQREQARHGQGRTTSFFVLQFEQDYSSAQLARLRAQAELLSIFAQIKLLGGSS